MKLKKFILAINIILSLLILFGCTDSLPIFWKTGRLGDEEGIVVYIDDVKYKMFPALKWSVNPGDVIGYAGNRLTTVSEAVDDTERNFIYLHKAGSDMYYVPLYRTDIEIPEPSADTVNEIYYSEFDFSQEEKISRYNWISDKAIIKEFFDILNTGKRVFDFSFFKAMRFHITCYSAVVPGAHYDLTIGYSDGKIVCGNIEEGYVQISEELLEKLAGYKINVEELVAENQES